VFPGFSAARENPETREMDGGGQIAFRREMIKYIEENDSGSYTPRRAERRFGLSVFIF
jgi:hypothetical protein